MTSEPIGSIWCEVCSTLVRDSSHLLKQPHEIAILDDLNLTPPAQQPDDALRVAALRSALERVVVSYLDVTVSDSNRPFQMYRIAKNALETDALEGAPYEPSEEMVERTADAIRRELHVRKEYPMSTLWTDTARAALRAAFSPPPADPPASA